MITLVRQLTLIIATASVIYFILAYTLYATLTHKTRKTFFALSRASIVPIVIFSGTMALGWWLNLDMHNMRFLLPVSSRIARTTLADILYLPMSASFWAIGSASLLLILIKKLLVVLRTIYIPSPIAYALSGASLAVSYASLYTGLSETKKNIILFADQIMVYSYYTNIILGAICALLVIATLIATIIKKIKRSTT